MEQRVKDLEKALSELLDAMNVLGKEKIILRPVTGFMRDGTVVSEAQSTLDFPKLEGCRTRARAVLAG